MLAIIPTDAMAADNIAKTSMWLTADGSFADEEFVEFISLKFISYMTRSLTEQQSHLRPDSYMWLEGVEPARSPCRNTRRIWHLHRSRKFLIEV